METDNNFIECGSALKNWWEFSESDIKADDKKLFALYHYHPRKYFLGKAEGAEWRES